MVSTSVTGSAATTTRRAGVGEAATASRSLAEDLGVGEEQRRVPAEEQQAGDPPGVG